MFGVLEQHSPGRDALADERVVRSLCLPGDQVVVCAVDEERGSSVAAARDLGERVDRHNLVGGRSGQCLVCAFGG